MFVFMKGEGREEKRIKKVKENGKGKKKNTYLDIVGKRNEKREQNNKIIIIDGFTNLLLKIKN